MFLIMALKTVNPNTCLLHLQIHQVIGREIYLYSFSQALKANNKYIRRFAELRSRKCSSNDQLTDVIGLLIERSCPYTVEMQQIIRPAKEARYECGSKKHINRWSWPPCK